LRIKIDQAKHQDVRHRGFQTGSMGQSTAVPLR